MKYLTSQFAKSKAFHALAVSLMTASLVGCGGDSGKDSGQIVGGVELPTALTFFYCPDEGVGAESCVLYNPANPYADFPVNSTNPDTETLYKWEFTDHQPQSAVARFYLWATAHAQLGSGENQYYTAISLHEIYTNDGNELAQEQAKRAYRSVLDNYFDSITFAANGVDSFLLRDFVGGALVNAGNGLTQLFDNQADAIAALAEWGYVYNAGTMEKIN